MYLAKLDYSHEHDGMVRDSIDVMLPDSGLWRRALPYCQLLDVLE